MIKKIVDMFRNKILTVRVWLWVWNGMLLASMETGNKEAAQSIMDFALREFDILKEVMIEADSKNLEGDERVQFCTEQIGLKFNAKYGHAANLISSLYEQHE